MINTHMRRLSPRYYEGIGTVQASVKFRHCLSGPESKNSAVTEWVARVQAAAFAFNRLRCQGRMEAHVRGGWSGYATEGHIFVYDQDAEKVTGENVVRFFDVLCDKPALEFTAELRIIVRIKSIFLAHEGVTVPFGELKLKERQRAAKITTVDVPCPMLN